MSFSSSRPTSMASTSSDPHKIILEHILSYPGTYEIPLRTMYALNSAQQPRSYSDPSTGQKLHINTSAAAQQLSASIMAELSQMPSSPTSLPPAFITSFLRKCFASELSQVDFAQALTGLDYLKDIETRRQRELKACCERLGLISENASTNEHMLQDRYPAVLDWYRALPNKVHKIEALYSELYISIRRWLMINEMSLTPFSKANNLAMLNSLYPPIISPTSSYPISAATMNVHRDTYFAHIIEVERFGTSVIAHLVQKGRRSGEENGWPKVRQVLDQYLQTCTSLIDECLQIVNINEANDISINGGRSGRKVDSGISFGQPSRKSSTSSEKSHEILLLPVEEQRPSSRSGSIQIRTSSTLEKIARELRLLRRTNTDVSEMMPHIEPKTVNDISPTTSSNEPQPLSKSLRKMKSLSSITLRRSASKQTLNLPSTKEMPHFDAQEMKKHRLAFEQGAS